MSLCICVFSINCCKQFYVWLLLLLIMMSRFRICKMSCVNVDIKKCTNKLYIVYNIALLNKMSSFLYMQFVCVRFIQFSFSYFFTIFLFFCLHSALLVMKKQKRQYMLKALLFAADNTITRTHAHTHSRAYTLQTYCISYIDHLILLELFT